MRFIFANAVNFGLFECEFMKFTRKNFKLERRIFDEIRALRRKNRTRLANKSCQSAIFPSLARSSQKAFALTLFFALNFALADIFSLSKFDENLLENGSFKGYLVSEKFDGVRALWDGKVLKSRSGKAFNAPSCWTKTLPPFSLDGEIFVGRGKFEELLSVVNSSSAECEAWHSVKYYIFDAPNASGTLENRLSIVRDFINLKQSKNLVLIKQSPVNSRKELDIMLKSVVDSGGEGLVIRKNAAPYEPFRTKNAMKLKLYEDSECKIIAHNEGKGKFKGKLGSITCEEEILITQNGGGNLRNLSRNSVNLGENSKNLKQNLGNLSENSSENAQNLSENSSSNLRENSSKNSANLEQNSSKIIRFKIGSGFKDSERENPPKIGSIITYKFYGRTKNDLPKFPVFLRVFVEQ